MIDGLDKEALAQPISPEVAKNWAAKGLFTIPNVTEEMPKGHTKGEYGQILEETGAGAVFGDNLPKLRKFYMPTIDNVVLINDREYLLENVVKSRSKGAGKNKTWVDGYIEAHGPLVRKPNGTINWKETPTESVRFSYDRYNEQIKRSPQLIQEKLSLINEFIEDQNIFVDKQTDKKFGTVTILPLQIDRAKRAVDKRLKQIESIQKNVGESLEKKEPKLEKAKKDLSKLREQVLTGKTPATPANYAVSVLETKFHSVPTLEELRSEIQDLQPPFDPQVNAVIKAYLARVVEWQIQKRRAEEAKKELDVTEREIRKEEDLPEMKELLLKKIRPVETLPGQYDKAKGFYGPEFVGTQAHEIEETTSTDYDELIAVKNSLDDALQVIVDLPKSSNEYLMRDGGRKLNQIQTFINNAKMFVKRYKERVYVPSEIDPDMMEINPKLFSKTSAGLGNALVAVVLNQVILSVTSELERIKRGRVEIETEPQTTPAPSAETREPVTSESNNDLTHKLSSALWGAFENRFKGQ